MRRCFAAILFGLIAVVLIALPASAAGPFGLSVSGAGIPFVAGDAGEDPGIGEVPEYQDAFDTGWGGRLEGYYDFTPSLRGQIGFTYQSWGGSDFEGFAFDDLKMWAIYIGGKYRFMPGSAFRPYLVGDVGYANVDAVDVALQEPLVVGNIVFPAGTSISYWEKTGTYFADLGLGFEYMLTPNLGIYLDARAQIFGPADEGVIPTAGPDPGISVPISLGLNYNF